MANEQMNSVSFMPEDMVQGGLADDFDGTITRARFKPWDYNGNLDHHVLSAELTILTADGDTVVQNYGAGDLQHFVPSKDGVNPVDLDNGADEELEGLYIVKTGKRSQLATGSNWYLFLSSAIDSGLPKELLQRSNISDLEGVQGHFDRLAQPKRSGLKVQPNKDGKQEREKMYLALTRYDGKVEVAAAATTGGGKSAGATKTAGKAAAAGKAATTAAPAADDAFQAKLAEFVLNVVAEAGELAKGKLPGMFVKAFSGTERATAIKLAGNVDFLGSIDGTVYDPETGVLTIG